MLNALLEYAFGTDPTAPDGIAEAPSGELDPDSGDFSFSFIRDPRANDLTYTVQTSSDLQNWIEIASSAAGDPTAGGGGVSMRETTLLGKHPQKTVEVTVSAAAIDGPRQQFRIQITRTEV